MTADLIVDHRGALISVQIAKPPDNLFTLEMCQELTGILLRPPQEARALLLTAAGPNFCLGRERTAMTPDAVYTMARELADLNAALINSKLTVIAQVSGDAAGFGVGLAALADVAIASTGARFWFPEAEAGLAPALVLTWLPAALGRRLAFWLTATGQPLDAQGAQRGGLINQAVPPDRLAETVGEAIELLLKPPQRVSAEIKDDIAAFAPLSIGQASDRAVDRLVLRSLVLDGQGRP
ncbi:MAG TPA: enoyl-CoA hydratase/isomerase family protein [Streptosporangiaceae bacterium]|nr:enoyl-CoA hydratase/isomerase family protein [Streptosporangiaceae bacterium]